MSISSSAVHLTIVFSPFFVTFQGKYDDAVLLLELSLAVGKNELGPEHPDVATALANLAVLLKQQVKAFRILQEIYCGS